MPFEPICWLSVPLGAKSLFVFFVEPNVGFLRGLKLNFGFSGTLEPFFCSQNLAFLCLLKPNLFFVSFGPKFWLVWAFESQLLAFGIKVWCFVPSGALYLNFLGS